MNAQNEATAAASMIGSDLHSILQETGVGIWSYDGATGRFDMDSACRLLFNLEPDEKTSPERMRECIHPEDLQAYWNAIRDCMTNDGAFCVEYRTVGKDGTVRFISSRGRVRPHLPGEPILINGVCSDVSDRRVLMDRLQANELQMRTLADNFPGLFCYVDKNYVVRFMSQRYIEHMGKPREQLIGRHLQELTGKERFAERRRVYDGAMSGHSHSFEEARQMPDGRQRYYAITYHPDRGLDGAIRGFVAIGLDITELRETERSLQARSRELSRSNRDLEQFAYVASHDLKAPLRAIEVLVDWLREDLSGYDQGDVQENLSLLAQRTGRLHRLLDDLLAYSRAGRATDGADCVDTGQMVRDIAVLLAPPATMRVEADASLPEIHAAAAPLEQVLRNLVNNAIKHHPTGTGLVRVFAEMRGSEVLFAVEDDGAGIPEEFSEKVFQLFQTLRPRDEVEGSGMGLAIVKRIVEGQGGKIWFRPGPNGRGTVFKFTWKLAPPAAGSTGATPGDEQQLLHSAG